MAVEVKIGGVAYIGIKESVQITEQARSTASTSIQVRLDALPIPVSLQSVQIFIDSVPVFAGHIETVSTPEYDTGFETRVVSLSIQSLEAILNRRLITRNWYNKYVHEIVQDIFAEYLVEEGIALGSISTTTIQINAYKKSYKQAKTVLDDLAKRVDGASFYISPDKKFYFLVASDFPQVDAPEHITELKKVDAYSDLRTVQVMKGASSRIVGSAENTTLKAEIAALSGTSGKIEKVESDSTIRNPTAAESRAAELVAQYAEREITLTCTCHDLIKTALYQTWAANSGHYPTATLLPTGEALPDASGKYPLGFTGLYTVVQRTISCFGKDQYKVDVILKNRNYFARYGYSIRQALEDAKKANGTIEDILSEDQLTPDKKIAARDAWNIIASEKDLLDTQADTCGVTTEKIYYDAVFVALANYLNAGEAWMSGYPLWLSDDLIAESTEIVGATYQAKWRDYYDAKADLSAAITAKQADNARAAALATVPKNLGRYEAAHPATHNPGDWWTVYDTDDDPIERGIWYDNAGTPTRISAVSGETGYTTDAALLAKLASCMADVAWCEKNSYGVAADYGIAMFFESFGAVTAFIQNLFAQNIILGESGYLKSHDYAESGGSPTAGFMLDVANQIIKAYGTNFVNTYIKNAQIIDAVISGILSTSEIETKKAVTVTWTAPANYYLASELIAAFGLTIGQTLVASGTFNGKTVTSISCTAEGGKSGPTVYVYFSDSTYLSGIASTLTQVTYPGSITVNQSALVKSLVNLHSVGIITTDKSFNSYNITTTSLGYRSSGNLNSGARSTAFTVYKPISVLFSSGNINSFKLELVNSGSYFTALIGNTTNPTAGFLNPGQYVFHNISESDSQEVTLLCVGAYGTTDGSSIWS